MDQKYIHKKYQIQKQSKNVLKIEISVSCTFQYKLLNVLFIKWLWD